VDALEMVSSMRCLLIGVLIAGCQPWRWPGDVSSARELAGRVEISYGEPLVVRVDRDLTLRFRPERSHYDGPSSLVARPCTGKLDTLSGPALSVWLPDEACVAQIDQRPDGEKSSIARDAFPLARVYADPFAYAPRVLANLRDNVSFAVNAMGGSLVGCSEPGPGDLVCTISWGDCLVVEVSLYFRVRPRPRGGTYVVAETGVHPGDGTEWWRAEIVENPRRSLTLPGSRRGF
jgi:hypothetical protein